MSLRSTINICLAAYTIFHSIDTRQGEGNAGEGAQITVQHVRLQFSAMYLKGPALKLTSQKDQL